MKYDLWQVRDRTDGSKIYIYAVRQDCSLIDFIDSSKYAIYNQKGTWRIKGFGDFPKFFRWDYAEGNQN